MADRPPPLQGGGRSAAASGRGADRDELRLEHLTELLAVLLDRGDGLVERQPCLAQVVEPLRMSFSWWIPSVVNQLGVADQPDLIRLGSALAGVALGVDRVGDV